MTGVFNRRNFISICMREPRGAVVTCMAPVPDGVKFGGGSNGSADEGALIQRSKPGHLRTSADIWPGEISTLGKVMMDPATPPSTKVRAADSIWSHTVKAIELEEIEARLAALEEAAQKPNR